MFGVNFALYYKFLIGDRFKAFVRDEEFRWYFILVIGFILAVSLINLPFYNGDFGKSLRYGSFQISSIMSTTGFVTADFNKWPAASHVIIIIAMLIGSCAGSTAGGMKVVRIIILSKLSRRNVRATGQPKKMEVIRLDGKAVDEHMLSQNYLYALCLAMKCTERPAGFIWVFKHILMFEKININNYGRFHHEFPDFFICHGSFGHYFTCNIYLRFFRFPFMYVEIEFISLLRL